MLTTMKRTSKTIEDITLLNNMHWWILFMRGKKYIFTYSKTQERGKLCLKNRKRW